MNVDMEPSAAGEESDQDAQQPQVMVEDVGSDHDVEWVDKFPELSYAGATHECSWALFEGICGNQILHGASVLGPLRSNDEWQLAK